MENDYTIEKDITNHFGTLYHPKSALVFYQSDRRNSDNYVEFFDMDENGSPINAHPLTIRESQRLSKCLSIQNKKDKDFLKPNGIMSQNILYLNSSDKEKVIWFTEAQERDLFFVENLTIPNGKANVPTLVWCANKYNLKVYAVENNQRPDDNTVLFYAPFFNVSENGNVCMGTVDVQIKNSTSLEEFIKSWETYFFNSYFSHLMSNHNPIKGNCVNLWRNLIENEGKFPTDILMNSNLILKNLL